MREQACEWLHDYAQSQRPLIRLLDRLLDGVTRLLVLGYLAPLASDARRQRRASSSKAASKPSWLER
jgi:hypothetical protein